MNDSQSILVYDLAILQAMLDELPQYLTSDATRWPLKSQYPALTIGGILMRLRRLDRLSTQLPLLDQDHYRRAKDTYRNALKERVVRFEQRAHQELHMRLSEWSGCLRDLHHDDSWYRNKVDTRVVVEELVAALEKRPYELQKQVKTELQLLDKNLKNRWSPGEFIWDIVWQPAYSKKIYWWLYGAPVAIAVP